MDAESINYPGMFLMIWAILALFTDLFAWTDYYGIIPGGAIMKFVAIIVLVILAIGENKRIV